MRHDNKIMIDIERALKIAAAEGAKAGVEAYKKEITDASKEQKDRRLRNTRLLLENYRDFKTHANEAVFEAEQITDEDVIDLFTIMEDKNEKIIAESIKRSNKKTRLIVKHIDAMVQAYKDRCKSSCRDDVQRRYYVIYYMYTGPLEYTAEEIGEKMGVSKRTIYRDLDYAVEALSVLFFGIDGAKTPRTPKTL